MNLQVVNHIREECLKIVKSNTKAYTSRYESKTINFNKILNLTKRYMQRKGQALLKYLYLDQKKKIQNNTIDNPYLPFLRIAWKLSFRELEFMSVQVFGRETTPDFSTYYYRLKKAPTLSPH